MKWIREHPFESVATFAAMSAIAMVVATSLVFMSDDDSNKKVAAPGFGANGTFGESFDEQLASNAVDDKVADGLKSFGNSKRPSGLGGEGGTRGYERHDITLTMSSQTPIGSVGYIVPTSVDKYYGVAEKVGRSWSLRTVVYGNPDYGQLFAQAGTRGNPVTCTITVDGRVTESRSTEGPYGQLFCQG